MARLFQSLGELGGHLDATPTLEFADAPVPLSHYLNDEDAHGPVWRKQPSVRKVVGFIARQVSSIPLGLYERVGDGDRRRVRDNQLARLLASPSLAPGQGPMRFWENVLIDGLLRDRWCIYVATRPDGARELVRFPPRHVRFVGDGLDRIEKIAVPGADRQWERKDPGDFLIDVGYSERGVNGTSPMITLKHLLEEQREAIEYRRSIWRRGARIPGVIERPTPWPKDGKARENFRRSWSAFQSGGGREGQTPVLDEGMKYVELKAFAPVDTGDLEGRRLSDAEVASAYWIPPELVGARDGNFSNMMAFKSMLYSVALGPYITARDEATAPLVTMFGLDPERFYIESNVEAKLRGSFEEQAQALQSSVGAPYMTRNEARALTNRPALPGGDDLVVPLNVLTGGQASPRDAGTQNLRAGPVRLVKAASNVGVSVKSEGRQEDAGSIESVLKSFFARQSAAVLSRLGAKAADAEWWDEERWNSELAADLYGLAASITQEIGRETLDALGIDPDGYSLGRTVEFLQAVAASRAGAINSTTRDKITAAISGDLEDDALTSTPAGVFEEAETSRATAAAITLATTLAAFAATESVAQTGRSSTKTWAVNSANPRGSHASMDGETVPVSELFSNGAMWPGDPVLGADGVAGCMCSVIVTIE